MTAHLEEFSAIPEKRQKRGDLENQKGGVAKILANSIKCLLSND